MNFHGWMNLWDIKRVVLFFSPIHTFMKVWVESNKQETEAKQQYIKFNTFICDVAIVFYFVIYQKEKNNYKAA